MTTAAAAAELPGITTVAGRAVRRIAAQAAREVAGVGRDVDAEARVTGDRTALDLRIPVVYPAPVGRVADACRAHVLRRTTELTGLAVTGVDIVIGALVSESAVVERRVR